MNMSNKQQAANFFHSREIENALRESIASNPATNRTIFSYAIDALVLKQLEQELSCHRETARCLCY